MGNEEEWELVVDTAIAELEAAEYSEYECQICKAPMSVDAAWCDLCADAV